jgi:hypothetical protein
MEVYLKCDSLFFLVIESETPKKRELPESDKTLRPRSRDERSEALQASLIRLSSSIIYADPVPYVSDNKRYSNEEG